MRQGKAPDSPAVTGGDLGRPAVTWDEVLSAVVDKNRQEITDPEVIVAPKTNTIKPRCRIWLAVDGQGQGQVVDIQNSKFSD